MTSKLKEGVMQGVFTLCACVSILAVALICIFLFANGVPTLFKIGPLKFLLGTTWKPGNDIFGILPMILGSIYVTAGAILVGVPIGLLTAIYMSKFASPRINKVMLPAVQLLAGIPSVVYGFFGMIVLGARRAGHGQVAVLQNRAPRQERQGHEPVYRRRAAGHHDPAHHHHGQQGEPRRRARQLLRGQPCPCATHERSVFYAVLPPQNPACCRQSSSALAAPSVRRWPSSWSRATRPGCPRVCSRACAR